MRLIDTQTHLLLEPWKAAGKEYAILSHTWGNQEVIFQEWEQLFPSGAIKGQCPHVRHDGIDKKAGYHKVVQACEQARRDGIRYLWCDTMCINKESSAELSEAINSMFKWYRDAKVCYVYLTDVTFPSKKTRHGLAPTRSNFPGWFPHAMDRKQDDDVREMKSRFMASRWWTRGWTLQELLAPKNVAFFTLDWVLVGHKNDIADWISALTRIHKEALKDHNTIKSFSVAQRMSWAADRQTTVIEDTAYCLLGIFDINMPMLYGQGESAFQKLQHEIIKGSDDQSIFAWAAEHDDIDHWTGALAKSPRSFKSCGSIVVDPHPLREPYSLTNTGFKMRIPLIRSDFASQFFLGLGCFLELHGENLRVEPVNQNRRRIRIWIPVQAQSLGGSYERAHFPTSHVYFQHSYPANKVLNNPDIFLLESPYRGPFGQEIKVTGAHGASKTGINVSIGFGNMSIVSKAYKDLWPPRKFQIISVGSRAPSRLSHELIFSGTYCIIMSVAWDERIRPMMHMYTTLGNIHSQDLTKLLDQVKQGEHQTNQPRDAGDVHRKIRAINHDAVGAGQSTGAPMIIVEDEPLYDMHQFANVMVDVIFKEKANATGNRKEGM